MIAELWRPHPCCPTKRALDWWDSAAFSSIFLASAFPTIMSIIYARPPASNANRWAFINNMNKNLFEKSVIENFHFLQDKYDFSAPVTKDFGREIYVRYERVNQTVAISYEFGMSPLIEIFYPSSETGDKSIPWESKSNMQRSRRFPKIKPTTLFSDDETSIETYLKEMALEFEKTEMEWLEAK